MENELKNDVAPPSASRSPMLTMLLLTVLVVQACQPSHENIFDAAYEGDLKAVKQFVEEDQVDVEASDRFGIEVIFHAVSGGHIEVVRYLLEKGADPLVTSPDGSSLLHLAAGSGDLELAALLIESGCLVDRQDGNGETPLMFAVLAEHRDAASFLVAKGASMTVTNNRGRTPRQLGHEKGWTNIFPAVDAPEAGIGEPPSGDSL